MCPTAGEVNGISNPPLKIASFNIQVFGERKMDRKCVMSTLVKILQRYDLILILEIRDSSETAFPELVQECNKDNPENPFSFVVSARLGRTSSKEQYGFMYRSKKIKLDSTFQFDDGDDDGTDMFQREPFAARFYSPSTELEDFAIIATHTDPDEAAKEIGSLHKVYESAKKHWNLEDIIIAGDFNADEGYVNREDWGKIVLRHDKRFRWLIKDSTDTTTGNTDRAYDRYWDNLPVQ
ncbi:deoxyribonuclease [Elysia marginata]|uniref:Deoxyribonuclease n=1 Tax=Elysia marginata TaxID=1093978 RepID=A0AAV4EWK0_9GAST|nr:deoxyribonuclease [Elysia marginata]